MTKKPINRLRRIKPAPKKNGAGDPSEKKPLTSAQKQDLAAVNFVMHHPHYLNILGAIRLGTTNADIADHFIQAGYFTINRKTAMTYLACFRRVRPDLCKPTNDESAAHSTNALKDYDHLFDGNVLALSTETELLKLIAVQKARVAIDFNSERNIGKLFNTTSKEVEVLGGLFEKLHKIKNGTGTNALAQGGAVFAGNEDEIKDGLQALKHDEASRNAMSGMIHDIMRGVKGSVGNG